MNISKKHLQSTVELLLESILCNMPLISPIVAKHFRTEDEEQPPVKDLSVCLLSVGLCEDLLHFVHLSIHEGEPGLQCLTVVTAIDQPFILQVYISLEVMEEIHRWHCPPGEEVLGHPLRVRPWLGVKGVREVSVTEHLNEELSGWLQPGGNPLEQDGIVLHVLKHFYGDNSVKAFVGGEFVGVCCDTL